MTDTFRALCAELINELHGYKVAHPNHSTELIDRARAALADEPAVPEGREPAAVTGHPSDEELGSFLVDVAAQHDKNIYWCNPLVLARAVLARWGNPAPTPPADGEVAELVAWLRHEAESQHPGSGEALPSDVRDELLNAFTQLTRAAELLQQQALVPVSVSERPWEREGWCDKNGNCWLGGTALGDSTPTWIYGPSAWAERFPKLYRTLLPAHAFPLPESE